MAPVPRLPVQPLPQEVAPQPQFDQPFQLVVAQRLPRAHHHDSARRAGAPTLAHQRDDPVAIGVGDDVVGVVGRGDPRRDGGLAHVVEQAHLRLLGQKRVQAQPVDVVRADEQDGRWREWRRLHGVHVIQAALPRGGGAASWAEGSVALSPIYVDALATQNWTLPGGAIARMVRL